MGSERKLSNPAVVQSISKITFQAKDNGKQSEYASKLKHHEDDKMDFC